MPITSHQASTSPSRAGKRARRGGRASWRRDESGTVAILTAVLLCVLLGFMALAVDVGHLTGVRNELQNAADSAALAGARALFPAMPGGSTSYLIPITDPPYCAGGVSVAGQILNRTEGQNIAIAASDVTMGHWGWAGETNYTLNTFTPLGACSLDVNAIKVLCRKDSTINNPVENYFARVFGPATSDVDSRYAIAACGYLSGIAPGVGFPIAINEAWRDGWGAVPGPITFAPDGTDTGGWCAPLGTQPSGSTLKNWINNGYPAELFDGSSIYLNNGVIDSAVQTLKTVLIQHSQTYTLNSGASYTGWLVLLPVVTVDKFNQSTSVVDFQPVIITEVNSQGNPKTITIVPYDKALNVEGGYSGGKKSNLYATLPRLVQ